MRSLLQIVTVQRVSAHPYIKSIIKSTQEKPIQKCFQPIRTKQDKKNLLEAETFLVQQ